MNDLHLTELQRLIGERTGIQFRPGDREKFVSAIEARMRKLSITEPGDYIRLLEQAAPVAAGENSEWQYLTAHLVPGESYFFRDTGQIALIQKELLPQIIASRRATGDLSLRIWSAGCSTGEEPYSLAALVYDLLPDYENWQVLILGTDPNEDAIQRAQTGRYTDWSFRQVSQERRTRFFHEDSGTFQILPEIQAMVTFRVQDLHSDLYPEASGQIHDLDLILCRNVFIYLQPNVIAGIVVKMERSLVIGGMLVTGHGELTEARPGHLVTRVFPSSIIYQKEEAHTESRSPAGGRPASNQESPQPLAVKPRPITTVSEEARPPQSPSPKALAEVAESTDADPAGGDDVAAAREFVAGGDYQQAVTKLTAYRLHYPEEEDAGYLLARAYANLGRHEAAALVLNEMLKLHPFGVRGYFLLSQISEEQGDRLRAMDLLKRSIYIEATYIPGYLELGLLYEREGDPARARRMLTSALDLLKGLAPGTEIEEYNGQTAAHLIERVEASLD